MNRLNLVLFAGLIGSCLGLIQASYEARRLFVAVERAQNEERSLETEYGRLQVEKRAEATPLRVDVLAREQLQMRPATPAVTHYVRLQEVKSIPPVDEGDASALQSPGKEAASSVQEAIR